MDETTALPRRLPRRLLGVWAHPDDESYLSAGLMARVIDAGGHVTVLVATAGELGFADDDHRPLTERAALRREELRCAMDAIGVTDVRVLTHPDGGLADAGFGTLVAEVGSTIDDVRPDLVVTFGPDGVTGHPDHVEIGRATTAAWSARGTGDLHHACHPARWWTEHAEVMDRVGLDGPGPAGAAPEAAIVAEHRLEPHEVERKRRALAGHASQTGALAATMGEHAYRAWWSVEWFRRPAGC